MKNKKNKKWALIPIITVLLMIAVAIGLHAVRSSNPSVSESRAARDLREKLLNDGEEKIVLTEDIVLSHALDVNGIKTISGGTITIFQKDETIFRLSNGSSLTIDGTDIDSASETDYVVIVPKAANFTLLSGKLMNPSKSVIKLYGTSQVNGGELFYPGESWVDISKPGVLEIRGGHFAGCGADGIFADRSTEVSISGNPIFEDFAEDVLYNCGKATIADCHLNSSNLQMITNAGELFINGSADIANGFIYTVESGTTEIKNANLHDSKVGLVYNKGTTKIYDTMIENSGASAVYNDEGGTLYVENSSIDTSDSHAIYNIKAEATLKNVEIKNIKGHAASNICGAFCGENITCQNITEAAFCNNIINHGIDMYGSVTLKKLMLTDCKDIGVVSYGGALNICDSTIKETDKSNIYVQNGDAELADLVLGGTREPDAACLVIGSLEYKYVNASLIRCSISGGSHGVINHGITKISDSEIFENQYDEGRFGGGVSNYGSLTLLNVHVRNNAAHEAGGGIYNANELVMTGGSISNNTVQNGLGGGICLDGKEATATISDAAICQNAVTSGFGGGIFVNGSDGYQSRLILKNTAVLENTAGKSAGGLFCKGSVTMEGSQFNKNTAKESAGGIYVSDSGSIKINNCDFLSNKCTEYGGGICNLGKLTVDNCKINENLADIAGGGIYIGFTGNTTIDKSQLNNNKTIKYGGGIYVHKKDDVAGKLTMTSTDMVGNASDSFGGALYVFGASDIDKCNILSNISKQYGGGISNYGEIKIKNCKINENVAPEAGGGIYVGITGNATIVKSQINKNKTDKYGGGIYVHKKGNVAGKLTMTSTDMVGNTSDSFGGAIYIFGASDINRCNILYNLSKQYGGGISNYGEIKIKKCKINKNVALEAGGGIYIGKTGNTKIDNSQINNNKANKYGGGIYVHKSKNVAGKLTMTSTDMVENTADLFGGALYISGASKLTNCTVQENIATNSGGGIYNAGSLDMTETKLIKNETKLYNGGGLCAAGDSKLTNCTVQGNTAIQYGGGIYTKSTENIEVVGSQITGNNADSGGGIWVNDGKMRITDSSISNNTAVNYGGGIYNQKKASCVISGSAITKNNAAQHGGGIYNAGHAELTNNCTVKENIATGSGGGICNAASLDMTDTMIIKNETEKFNGGGLSASAGSVSNLNCCIVQENTAKQNGGGISNTGTATINSCEIKNNAASIAGGAIYIGNTGNATIIGAKINNNTTGQYGGGIYIHKKDKAVGKLIMENTELIGNKAEHSNKEKEQFGGGIYNAGDSKLTKCTVQNNTATFSGGGICNAGSLDMTETKLIKNETKLYNGGGLNTSGNAKLTNCIVQGNTAKQYGGGIYTKSTENIEVIGSQIADNNADSGGGIWVNDGKMRITDSSISNNTAVNFGGGIYNQKKASCVISGSTITGNNAKQHGGGIYNAGDVKLTDNCTVQGNTATGSGGGICNAGSLDMIDTQIIENAAETYNGGGLNTSGNAKLTDCTVQGNTATQHGGGIYNKGASDLTGCTVQGNTATQHGGGICNSGKLTADNCRLNENGAAQFGGGVYTSSLGNSTISGSQINNNNAQFGGGVSINSLDTSKGELVMTETELIGNTASLDAGAMYIKGIADIGGCTVKGNIAERSAAGVCLDKETTVNITGTKVIGNTAKSGSGGGVYVNGSKDYQSKLTIRDSVVSENNCVGYGGGFYIKGWANADNCEINKNNAPEAGGAIYIGNTGNAEIANSQVNNNKTEKYGGGIYVYKKDDVAGKLTMTSTNMVENTAKLHGGGICTDGDVKLDGCTIRGNSVTQTNKYGGGIFVSGTANVTVANSQIIDNNADSGGGIWISGKMQITDNSSISNNTAVNFGGGIYNQKKASCVISGSTITKNNAKQHGGGIYNAGDAKLTGCTIQENTVENAKQNGGGICNSANGTLNMTDTNIIKNTATQYGGGICTDGDAELTGCTVQENTAKLYGGGIFVSGTANVTVANSQIIDNHAGSGGGIWISGKMQITDNSTISNNTAVSYGGGIYNNSNASCTVSGTTVTGNKAGKLDGEGIFSAGKIIIGEGSSIYGNFAGEGVYTDLYLFKNASLDLSGKIRLDSIALPEKKQISLSAPVTLIQNSPKIKVYLVGYPYYEATPVFNPLYGTVPDSFVPDDDMYYFKPDGTVSQRNAFSVTFNGTPLENAHEQKDYEFAVPNYYPQMYTYGDPVITIGGEPLPAGVLIGGNGEYKIPGNYVNGNIVITMEIKVITGGIKPETEAFIVRKGQAIEGTLLEIAAAYEPGETIYIHKDVTLTEQLRFEKDVAIEADSANRMITVYRPETPTEQSSIVFAGADSGKIKVALNGIYGSLTFDGGGENKKANCAMIRCEYADLTTAGNVILQNAWNNAEVADGSYVSGGALYAENSEITFNEGAFLKDNHADNGYGGAVDNFQSQLTVNGAEISGNSAHYGGGIFVSRAANVTVANSQITGNKADSGGGIWISGEMQITNKSSISNNTAKNYGGGIYNNNNASCVISAGSTIKGNNAKQHGGGIYNKGKSVLTNCTVEGNTATGSGGGIYNAGSLDMTNTNINENKTEKFNGGGLCTSGDAKLTNCIVQENTAKQYGGGIYTKSTENIEVIGSQITANNADSGGGIWVNDGKMQITDNSSISNNTAVNFGGGIYNQRNASCVISGSTITGNNAKQQGGGIYNANPSDTNPTGGLLTMTGGAVSGGNSAKFGAGILAGGAVNLSGVEVTGNKCTYTSFGGAGIAVTGNLELNGCSIYNNSNKAPDNVTCDDVMVSLSGKDKKAALSMKGETRIGQIYLFGTNRKINLTDNVTLKNPDSKIVVKIRVGYAPGYAVLTSDNSSIIADSYQNFVLKDKEYVINSEGKIAEAPKP